MGESPDQKSAWQLRIGQGAVPHLEALADELERLSNELLEGPIPYWSDEAGDLMAIAFVLKQKEHLRSVRLLIEAKAHRDALLIARTMTEGLTLLLWAYNKLPERPDLQGDCI